VIRITSVPHAIGNDSFTVHILANSISVFGEARWWVHPLSIFGFYPYSSASAVPFILSGISQCTGVKMELTIWIYGLILGFIGMFAAYIMAGKIIDDDLFKFLVAFSFSLSAGILAYSTWYGGSRSLFIALLPLLIYLVLKTRKSMIKYSMLIFILFILLMAIHHYFYFTIPIIFSFVILTTVNKLKGHIKPVTTIKIPNDFVNIAFIIIFWGVFMMPFFTGLFIEGGRYDWLDSMLKNNVRYSGILIVFAIGGFTYLLLKHDKSFEEWFLLLTLLFLAPLMYIKVYAHYIILIFSSILIGIALTNITNIVKMDKQKKKYVFSIIIITLLLCVSFSGFYQHWHTNVGGRSIYHNWYMEEATYNGALWVKDNINADKRLVGNDNLASKRMFAISETPTLIEEAGDCMLTCGFTNISDINITKNSPLTIEFYMDSPYVLDPSTHKISWYRSYLQEQEIDSWWGKEIITKFNLSYVIENQNIGKNVFIQSLHMKKNSISDNGKIRIWCLD
jgi:hypothetical protein